jgi:ABC-type cobalamin/Fe3+-siderophores transport system ATPase subunit
VPFELDIPLTTGGPLAFSVDVGQVVFVLGANGTGKSSLMQRFYNAHSGSARRISASRQTWFDSNVVSLTPQGKKQTEKQIVHADSQPESRWKEHHSAARASIAIYDLIDAENVRARAITGAVDEDNIILAKQLAKKDALTRTRMRLQWAQRDTVGRRFSNR